MNSKPILAWHFSTGELDFDMKGTQIVAGLKVSINAMPHLGYKGFHGCTRPLDALDYFVQRPNPDMHIFVSRVVLSGRRDISGGNIRESKNIASEAREHLWVADAKGTVEEFGISCYQESLRVLRTKNYVISPTFDEALKARIGNSDDLPDLAKSARDEAASSAERQIFHVRLALVLMMNTIDFAVANAKNLADVVASKYLDQQQKEFVFRATGSDLDYLFDNDAHYKTIQSSNNQLHDMLMQLAPEGYSEDE